MKQAIINRDTIAIVWRHPIHFLSLGFGAGVLAIAPGTMGTVAAIPIYYFLQTQTLLIYISVTIAMFFVGIGLCAYTARALNTHDHPGIVWDEIVGFLITMMAIPFTWYWVLCGFLLFRLFDIWKPFPIKQMDKHITGGLGIMLDDVLAGLYAWSCLWMLIYLTGRFDLV